MSIILSQTYEIVTEESASEGDAAERGFNWQDQPHTFRETVYAIESGGFIHPSSYPVREGEHFWLTSEAQQDFTSGDYRSESLHPGRDARSIRYFYKACKAAGVRLG